MSVLKEYASKMKEILVEEELKQLAMLNSGLHELYNLNEHLLNKKEITKRIE